MDRQLIISCEHAGNEVPQEYRHFFKDEPEMLQTHRGIDIGALELTNTIAEKMEQEAYLHTVTRLLVDLNRSVQSPVLFSEFTREASLNIREDIFKKYYQPHREKVKNEIEEITSSGNQAIHVGVHTFTPFWKGRKREVDVGFLYDPSRSGESNFCHRWRHELDSCTRGLNLEMNKPYRGTMDGFTTYLRRNHSADNYIGIEIEVNQRFTDRSLKDKWQELQKKIARSLKSTLEKFS